VTLPPTIFAALALAALAAAPSLRAETDFSGQRMTAREVLVAPVSRDRLIVSGVVTYAASSGKYTIFVVQDPTGSVYVYGPEIWPIVSALRHAPLPKPGDTVEVVGEHLTARQQCAQLFEADWIVTGHQALPEPKLITMGEAMAIDYDGRRVRLRGTVVDYETMLEGDKKISRVWVRSGDVVTYGNYIGPEHAPAPGKVGQMVEMEGVCNVSRIAPNVVRNFAVQLSSMADVHLLPAPMPWENPETRRTFAIVAGVLIAAGAWVLLLRRQVRARTAALAESEARHRLVVDTALDAVVSIDGGGAITGWNAQAERTFGWPAEAVLGRPFAETVIAANGREAGPPAFAEALATGQGSVLNHRVEATARHRNGHEFPVELAIAPLKSGTARTFSAFIRDITARKQAEAELLRTVERERQLGRLKTNFVSMVSHELRTPLEVILTSTDILDRYLDRLPPEGRAGHLDAIQTSVKRMAGMMEEVLVLGRLDAGRLQCQPDDVHLGTWCRRLLDEMRSSTGGRCPMELDFGDFDPLVRADEGLLRHIFTNLLSNAVKYSPAGGAVTFSVQREGGEAVFRITDCGIGIPPADLPRLFDAFHRGANAGNTPGTGLGLVIVKRCVELHRGSIEFQSREGQGTTVTVRLPLFEISP
jgi:PAS domain S-box-containing protein